MDGTDRLLRIPEDPHGKTSLTPETESDPAPPEAPATSTRSPEQTSTVILEHSEPEPTDGSGIILGDGAVTHTDLEPITTVINGKYRVLRKLGEGGMGAVYLVEHIDIGKKFAVKVMLRELARNRDITERLIHEARTASIIENPHVVSIVDYGIMEDGSVFLVMEYLEGRDLANVIDDEGPLPWKRARHIALQICSAIAKAHERKIIHRDLKPDNIFITDFDGQKDFIKILDFGIAKISDPSMDTRTHRTRAGIVLGTPHYMAPEQAVGQKPTHLVDIYATGVIVYQMVTGRLPFEDADYGTVMRAHITRQPPALLQANPDIRIPAGLQKVISKALEKKPEKRYQSMEELRAAIEALPEDLDDSTAARPSLMPKISPVWLAAGASMLTALLVAGFLFMKKSEKSHPEVIPLSHHPNAESSREKSRAKSASKTPQTTQGAEKNDLSVPRGLPTQDKKAPLSVANLSIRVPNAPQATILLTKGWLTVLDEGKEKVVTASQGPVELGKTPLSLKYVPTGDSVEVTIRARGYRDRVLHLKLDGSKDIERLLVKKTSSGPARRHTGRSPAKHHHPARKKGFDLKPGEII